MSVGVLIEEHDGIACARIRSEATLLLRDDLIVSITALCGRVRGVVFDASMVRWVNSSMMGTLIQAVRVLDVTGVNVAFFPRNSRLERAFRSPSMPPVIWCEGEAQALSAVASRVRGV